MSGHNKWSTIKHKKGAADAKRSKIFTKILKEITIAARLGGGDPGGNPRLRSAMDKARENNMPKDNMERAIKKGTGELEGVNYEEITYEVYGPGGAALIVEVMTDNVNRTVAEMRSILNKHNGNLGKSGAVSWKFDRKGVIEIAREGVNEDALMEAALEVGAEDIKTDDEEIFEVLTAAADLLVVSDALKERKFHVKSSEVQMLPKTTVHITGRDAEVAWKLFSLLDDHDDVQNVWHDFDIDDEELEAIANR